MEPTTVGLIGLAVLIIALFSRMPVGFVMALLGILGFSYVVSWASGLRIMAKDFFTTFGSYSLTVVPLFILMGQVAFHGGISRRLFDTAYTWLGSLPGGLGIATIGACAGFAAICGSTNAAVATMTLDVCRELSHETGIRTVALSGGVFQNRLLLAACRSLLTDAGLRVLLHTGLPANDGCISLGQAVVAAYSLQS